MINFTQIKNYYLRFDYYCDLVVIQNKKNVILLSVWFFGGVMADFLFSIIGFLTIGIEYEKNPLVVQTWQSNTYLDYLIIYILGNLIFFLLFFECLVLLGIAFILNKKFILVGLCFILGIPAYVAIEHYSQGLSWIIAILLNKDGNILFHVAFLSINAIIWILLLIRFICYDYNTKDVITKTIGESNE